MMGPSTEFQSAVYRQWLLPLAGVFALTGCGGGDGTSNIVPPPTTYNLQTAMQGLVTHGLKADLDFSGTLGGVAVTGTGTVTYAAGADDMFNGVAAVSQSQVVSATISDGTQTAPYATHIVDFYDPGNYAWMGEASSSEFDVASSPVDYPTSVVPGSSGMLGTLSRYTDNTMSVALGTVDLSYVVKAPSTSGGLPIVEFTETFFDTNHAATETDVLDWSITTGNVLALVSGSAQSGSDTLSFTAH